MSQAYGQLREGGPWIMLCNGQGIGEFAGLPDLHPLWRFRCKAKIHRKRR